MTKLLIRTLAVLLCMVVVAACSGDSGCYPDDGQERTVTVRLLPEGTRTTLTLDAQLLWAEGDKVAFYTSADGSTWSTSREATIDAATGRFTATGIPSAHKQIRVVYPSPGEGEEYASPKVEHHQCVGTEEFQRDIDDPLHEGKNQSMISGRFLPMETAPTPIPANGVVDARYRVLGAVVRFNIPVVNDGNYYAIKAVRAGNYLFECQVDWPSIDPYVPVNVDGTPLNYYADAPYCLAMPVGEGIDYTPTVYVQVFDSNYNSTLKQYRRKVKKTKDLTAKAYDITLNFSNADLYDVIDGWGGMTEFKDDEPDDENLDYSQREVTPYHYGYEFLTEKEQKVTEYIAGKLRSYENSTTAYTDHCAYMNFSEVGYTMDFNALMLFLNRIQADFPETFHMYTTPRYDSSKYQYYARVFSSWPIEKYTQTLADIEAVIKEMLVGVTPSMSDYEKVRILHDRFLTYAHYGGMSDANGGNIVGGFINKKAVCEGLSRSWLYLCQHADIKCIYISGAQYQGSVTDAETGAVTEKLGNHAWNYTMVDGKWYLMDLSEDGGFYNTISYQNGFLKGKDRLQQGYRLYANDGSNPNSYYPSLPTLSDTDYECDRTTKYLSY